MNKFTIYLNDGIVLSIGAIGYRQMKHPEYGNIFAFYNDFDRDPGSWVKADKVLSVCASENSPLFSTIK